MVLMITCISKCKETVVVNALFNNQPRKFRRRTPRERRRIDLADLTARVETLLLNYKSCGFCFGFRSLVLSLPRKCMAALG